VGVSGAAGEALSAGQVAFEGNLVANLQAGDAGTDLDDGSCAFMAQDDREVEVERLG
jgi:hypothetical protein